MEGQGNMADSGNRKQCDRKKRKRERRKVEERGMKLQHQYCRAGDAQFLGAGVVMRYVCGYLDCRESEKVYCIHFT
jgi:hypothetical protein